MKNEEIVDKVMSEAYARRTYPDFIKELLAREMEGYIDQMILRYKPVQSPSDNETEYSLLDEPTDDEIHRLVFDDNILDEVRARKLVRGFESRAHKIRCLLSNPGEVVT